MLAGLLALQIWRSSGIPGVEGGSTPIRQISPYISAPTDNHHDHIPQWWYILLGVAPIMAPILVICP